MNWVKNKTFLKESVLVVFVILNSFLVHLHTVVHEPVLDSLFGRINFEHGHGEHQILLWKVLLYLQPLVYLSVLFFLFNRRFKYSLLFLFYGISFYAIYEMLDIQIGQEIISINIIKLYCLVGTGLFFLIYKVGQIMGRVPKEESFRKGDIALAAIILSLPICEKLIRDMPRAMESVSFLGYQISAGEWSSLKTLFWYVLTKMYVFVPLVICYLTIKRWWRYALLFPILMVSFQVINGLNPNVRYADEHEVLQAFPYLLVILVLLLFLARSAYYQSLLLSIYKKTYGNIEKVLKQKTSREEQKIKMKKKRWLSFKQSNKGNIQEMIEFKKSLEEELERMKG